jgi:DNA modification methylase
VSEARYVVGDVFAELAKIPDGSIDLITTSPPFLALRSYLPADHPDKHREIGSEPSPAVFLSTLLALTREWRRVLAPHGSIAVELGDTYSGTHAGGDSDDGRPNTGRTQNGYVLHRLGTGGPGWPLAKSLCGIPTLYAWSLAYGRNLLDPADTIDPWRIRNVVVWHRPNPPVGALGDKVRPSTSYITVATVAQDRWFDLDAERTEHKPHTLRYPRNADHYSNEGYAPSERVDGGRTSAGYTAGAPPLDCWFDSDDGDHLSGSQSCPPQAAQRGIPGDPTAEASGRIFDEVDGDDVWTIPTQPFRGAHYATWPARLASRLINLNCPRHVCVTCGQPRRRLLGIPEYPRTDSDRVPARLALLDGDRVAAGVNQHTQANGANTSVTRTATTLGWSECGCGAGCRPTTYEVRSAPVLSDEGTPMLTAKGKPKMKKQRVVADPGHCADEHHWRRGLVLDPFAGSGTTLSAASGLGRDSIGIDLDESNLDLARQRIGMFLVEGAA